MPSSVPDCIVEFPSCLLEQGNNSVRLEGIFWVTELNFPLRGTKSCSPVDRCRHRQEMEWLLDLLAYLLEYKQTYKWMTKSE